ncbi:MAG: serine O-acetyltransferase [Clostridia bacterium]|nr:serine O-acetyltransferase [Clostridia bacterium]
MGLIKDAKSIARRDPAARNAFEVFFLYPGYHALIYHKIARAFYKIKLKFIARWISQICTRRTGIEIHPGATIGEELFIDHGHGVVIGETAVVGNNCTIYHQVTLGGTGHEKHCKRHPTVGNNVLIGAGSKILGPVTVGDNAMIGAGSVVVNDVPPCTTVTGVKAQVIKVCGERVAPSESLEQRTGDPFKKELDDLKAQLEELKKRLDKEENDK